MFDSPKKQSIKNSNKKEEKESLLKPIVMYVQKTITCYIWAISS